jgi:hypothetical protein
MNERRQRLMRLACRSSLALQILVPAGPYAVLVVLSANLRFESDSGAMRRYTAGTRRLRNYIAPGSGKDARPCGIACPAPDNELPGMRWRKELTPKTTESHWSGGQREP